MVGNHGKIGSSPVKQRRLPCTAINNLDVGSTTYPTEMTPDSFAFLGQLLLERVNLSLLDHAMR